MVEFYSNDCPKCKILESKLKAKSIAYTKNDSLQEIIDLGYKTVPLLKVDNDYLVFSDAINYVNGAK